MVMVTPKSGGLFDGVCQAMAYLALHGEATLAGRFVAPAVNTVTDAAAMSVIAAAIAPPRRGMVGMGSSRACAKPVQRGIYAGPGRSQETALQSSGYPVAATKVSAGHRE